MIPSTRAAGARNVKYWGRADDLAAGLVGLRVRTRTVDSEREDQVGQPCSSR
jgi:hypothetical protein